MTKKWSDDELRYLRKNYTTTEYKEIGAHIGRSTAAVRNKCYELGLSKVEAWSDDEIGYLRVVCSKGAIDINEIAKVLGRTRAGVACKINDLGLGDPKRPITEAARANYSGASKERLRKYGHPRGMKGKKHTAETKERISADSRKMWQDEAFRKKMDEMVPESGMKISRHMVERLKKNPWGIKTRGAGGTREDLGRYFRSSWEANVARYLNVLVEKGTIHKWEYETDTFWFEHIKRGSRSYTPDFKIWDKPDSEPYYWEVKGWMDQKSRTKLDRMKRYYPNVRVEVIGKNEYKAIKTWASLIPGWEFGG